MFSLPLVQKHLNKHGGLLEVVKIFFLLIQSSVETGFTILTCVIQATSTNLWAVPPGLILDTVGLNPLSSPPTIQKHILK